MVFGIPLQCSLFTFSLIYLLIGIKRGRMRRKSICTNHPELETTYASGPLAGPINRQFSSPSYSTSRSGRSGSTSSKLSTSPTNNNSSYINIHGNGSTTSPTASNSDQDGPTVRKRMNKPKRKNSFRWSLNSTIFEKYF